MTFYPYTIDVHIERGASAEEVRYIQTLLENTSGISEVRFVDSEQRMEEAIKAMAWMKENFKIREYPPKSPPVTPENGGNRLGMFSCTVEDTYTALRVMLLISPDIPGVAYVGVGLPKYLWDNS